MEKKILIVEDDLIIAQDIRATINNIGCYTTDTLSTVEQAMVFLENKKYDLLLIDSGLNEPESIVDLSLKLSERFIIPVLFLITYEDLEKLKPLFLDSFFNFIIKPFQKEEFKLAIEKEIYYFQLKLQLKENNNRYTKILDNIDDSIIITDNQGYITNLNSSAEKLINYKIAEKTKVKLEDICKIVNPKTSEIISFTDGQKDRGICELVFNNKTLNYYSAPIIDYRYGYENILIVLQTHDGNKEKQVPDETQLKKINHRYRNNLQLLSSIFNLQSKTLVDEKNKSLFTDTQNRIRTLGYINESNYNIEQINSEILSDYINKIVINLFHTYKVNSTRIKLIIDIDKISFNSKNLLPFGLIINELVSNSLKHGFKNITDGELNISFKEKENNYLLSIKDTGAGFPPNFQLQNAETLGLNLVCELTKQLEGEIKLENEKGANFVIILKIKD